MLTPAEIVDLYRWRRLQRAAVLRRMQDVRDAYYGDVIVPLPELDRNEKSGVPNLTAQGIDQYGSRIGSTEPQVKYPVRRSGSKAAEDKARDKRLANLGWWDANHMTLLLPRRGRHLVAYGCSPVRVKPCWTAEGDEGHPSWEVLNPLATFPAETGDEWRDITPADCVEAIRKPYWWVKNNYPYQANVIVRRRECRPDTVFDLLRYEDAERTVLLLVGQSQGTQYEQTGGSPVEVLEDYENRTGLCPVVVPGRITLERIAGQFDQMIGMHYWQARMFALEAIAVEKGIFPDQWLIANPNEVPEIIVDADGRSGQVGVVKGGQFRDHQVQPGYMTTPTINYLERSGRLTAGIPAEFGGESPVNVRTGRRGENVLSSTIDPVIAEAQKLLSVSLEAENKRAIAVDRTYHNVPKTFYVKWSKGQGTVDYTPEKLWDSDENVVSYSFAGSDVNGLVISAGQRVGMGTMSKRRFMEVDPMVPDPEHEHDQVTVEAIEAALLQSVQSMASAGEIPPADLARIMQLVRTDQLDLADAVMKAQEEAQERQATQVPPEDPAAQPGLAVPGMGAESPAIGEPGPSMDNLTSLLSKLRRPQAQATPQELAVG